MPRLGSAIACCLALFLAGCLETSHYAFHGDQYAITVDGAGRVMVRNLRTGAVVEDPRDGYGPFAKKLLLEGDLKRSGGDTIVGGGPAPERRKIASPGPIVEPPPRRPPARNDIADLLDREGGGD